jgi:hypothetical protein
LVDRKLLGEISSMISENLKDIEASDFDQKKVIK